MAEISWGRALNLLSGGLLIVYAVARWGNFLLDEQDVGWAAGWTGTTLLLLVASELRPDWRPRTALLLLALFAAGGGFVAFDLTGKSSASDRGASPLVFEAPTVLLTLCVVLSNRRGTAIVTLATVLLVAGSGFAAYPISRDDPWGGVWLLLVSVAHTALAAGAAVVVGVCRLVARGRASVGNPAGEPA